MISIYGAFFLDYLLGDPYGFPHPVRLIGKMIAFLEKSIRKVFTSSLDLKIGGIILTATVALATYSVTWGILWSAKKINIHLYFIFNVILLWTCLAPRCLQKEALKIYDALTKKDLVLSRKFLSYIVGRDTENLEEKEVLRGVVETVAENTSDGVIAPLFYMFIGGAPLALTYKAINTMDSMIGYKNDAYLHLGWAAAKLDDIVNYIPARLTAGLIGIASYFLKLNYKHSFYISKRDGRNHSSPNSGYPEAAVAGALGIRVGGTNFYFGKPVEKPTIGDAHRGIEKKDILLTTQLMYGAAILAIVIFSIVRGLVF